MGEMVEKVARVLSTDGLRRYDISADKMVDCTWEQLDPLWREMYLRKARAAMAAMSEPSVAMCVAGLNSAHADRCKCGAPWSVIDPEDAWPAMIAAALSSTDEHHG